MMNDVILKQAKLEKVSDLEYEIINNKDRLNFFLKWKSNGDCFSLSFGTIASNKKISELKISEHYNFLSFIDEGDIVFGNNGVFNLDLDINMDIVKYLPNRYLVNLNFRTDDDYIVSLEFVFNL